MSKNARQTKRKAEIVLEDVELEEDYKMMEEEHPWMKDRPVCVC